jgi:hypothetical protein
VIGIAASTSVGFGGEYSVDCEPAIDRRDKKLATPTDLMVMRTLKALLSETNGDGASARDTALFIASRKDLTACYASYGLDRAPSYGLESFSAGHYEQLLESIAGQLNPSLAVSALPNLDMYLAAKTFEIGGHVDHLTCDPWADVASMLLAYQAIALGEVQQAAVVGVFVDRETETELLIGPSRAQRQMPLDDPRYGGLGILLRKTANGSSGRTLLARPLLAVSASTSHRRRAAASWLEEVGDVDRLRIVGGAACEAASMVATGVPTAAVEYQAHYEHGIQMLGSLLPALSIEGSIAVLVDLGMAVGGVALR